MFLASTATSQAATSHPQSSSGFGFQPTTGQVAIVGVVLGATGVGIGLGVYYAVHHAHTLTGCAATGADGLSLTDGSGQSWALVGDVAGIPGGEKVRVTGKREKASGGAPRQFLVEKTAKDLGACRVPSAGR